MAMQGSPKAGISYKTDSRITVKVKVLSAPKPRQGSRGESAVATVIESLSKSVKTAFMPLSVVNKMEQGHFYLLKNVAVGQFLRLSEISRIMQCGSFEYPQEVEENYFHPPTVSVREALSSPLKRRVSITGELTDVSPILTTSASRRKVLKLCREEETIEVKLWGTQADMQTPPIGQTVTVSCVSISQYQGKVDANSTDMTQIDEVTEKTMFRGEVEAAAFEVDDASIILKGEDEVWTIDHLLLQTVFPLEVYEENVRVKGERQGTKILSLERIETDE